MKERREAEKALNLQRAPPKDTPVDAKMLEDYYQISFVSHKAKKDTGTTSRTTRKCTWGHELRNNAQESSTRRRTSSLYSDSVLVSTVSDAANV